MAELIWDGFSWNRLCWAGLGSVELCLTELCWGHIISWFTAFLSVKVCKSKDVMGKTNVALIRLKIALWIALNKKISFYQGAS